MRYSGCFNPQRGGYKLEDETKDVDLDALFQSPKGRLQTGEGARWHFLTDEFQSPKGRLQTNITKGSGENVVWFQSPKGRLQTNKDENFSPLMR